jgi:hypothetical protein
MSFNLRKSESMTEEECHRVIIDRAIGRAIAKSGAGAPLDDLEALSLRFGVATGYRPTAKSLKFSETQREAAIPSNHQLINAVGQSRVAPLLSRSLFRDADTRHTVWSYPPA